MSPISYLLSPARPDTLMTLEQLLPTFIPIPAGPFPMGTPERDLSGLAKAYGGTRESYREEAPQHTVQLPAFAIAREPVCNALYAAYVAAKGARAPIHWRGSTPPEQLRDHPVADVSWDEAVAFCAWLNQNIQDGRLRIGGVLQNEGQLAGVPKVLLKTVVGVANLPRADIIAALDLLFSGF